jgi:hypothetical protein
MPHGISKKDSIEWLLKLDCFDLDVHLEAQHDRMRKAFNKRCQKNDDAGEMMLPLTRQVQNDDGTYSDEHYSGRHREMNVEQHHQVLEARSLQIIGDLGAWHFHFDGIDGRLRPAVQRRLSWMPPRPPEVRDESDEDA